MNIKTSVSEDFNSNNVLLFLIKWRKVLLPIAIASIVISTIVAFAINEKYKSIVILFPATSSSISKALLDENSYKQDDVMRLGAEEEAEQMLQILNSDQIRTRICEKYKLMQHYKIDTNDRYKRTKLYEEFQDNITFKHTEYMSVKIEVLDTDPFMASCIANDIASLHDSAKARMLHARAEQALAIVEREYHSKEEDVNHMTDSIKILNSFGIYDYESQSEVTSEQYAIAIAKGDQRAIKSLEEKLKIISNYGSAYVSLRDNLFMQRKQLNLLKTKYEEAKVDAEQIIPQKFIVSSAFPAEKKTYPIRWLIVLVSSISSILISIIVLLFVENILQFKKI